MTTQTKGNLFEFDIQASDFLEVTKTDIQIEYHDYDYHFEGDKDKRDIYNVILKRGNRQYAFKFGQSLADSGYFLKRKHDDKDNERQVVEGDRYFFITDERHGKWDGIKVVNCNKWICRTKAGRDHWLYCGFGRSWECYKKVPSEYSILACLVPHNPGTFEEFCWHYGYSDDSIAALKVYNRVVDEFKSLCTLYTDAELSMLGEIL